MNNFTEVIFYFSPNFIFYRDFIVVSRMYGKGRERERERGGS